MTTNSNTLWMRGVGFSYTKRAPIFDALDLDVPNGIVRCILGPSGCGKTTLLRLISGLEPLDRGSITIAGRVVASESVHLPPEKRRVGMVFQDFALFPNLSVRRNVLFGVRGGNRRSRRAKADQLLERVGMMGFADRMPHTLSGGQQQRVALARALASSPEVMLLDEPFSSLDADLRSELRVELLGILRRAGIATVMVTHDPQEASAVADEITWLTPPAARPASSKNEKHLGANDEACACPPARPGTENLHRVRDRVPSA